mmetsp:Transcript_111807/g.360976  ORF Transcript_111807/g.360976 Transcript_111807/m.360976 type:complete len:243 (-) Transcript_111807:39-767(-)
MPRLAPGSRPCRRSRHGTAGSPPSGSSPSHRGALPRRRAPGWPRRRRRCRPPPRRTPPRRGEGSAGSHLPGSARSAAGIWAALDLSSSPHHEASLVSRRWLSRYPLAFRAGWPPATLRPPLRSHSAAGSELQERANLSSLQTCKSLWLPQPRPPWTRTPLLDLLPPRLHHRLCSPQPPQVMHRQGTRPCPEPGPRPQNRTPQMASRHCRRRADRGGGASTKGTPRPWLPCGGPRSSSRQEFC